MKAFARCGKSLLKASHLKFWYGGKYYKCIVSDFKG